MGTAGSKIVATTSLTLRQLASTLQDQRLAREVLHSDLQAGDVILCGRSLAEPGACGVLLQPTYVVHPAQRVVPDVMLGCM